MNKLWSALLALVPLHAVANEDDPIAYKCYYCTESEMEDVALEQGVGRHYVFDYSNRNIIGFQVEKAGSGLVAHSFAAEDWVKTQFNGMVELYRPEDGKFVINFNSVVILAPGTELSRDFRYLWGHHLSALHPDHARSRELVHRYLMSHPKLSFLDTSVSNGRLLKLEHTIDNPDPINASLTFTHVANDYASLKSTFHFDHTARKWTFFDARDRSHPIQQAIEDFAPEQGDTYFSYDNHNADTGAAFVQRAGWASIPVHGMAPDYGAWKFVCSRDRDDIQCSFR